MKLLLTGSAGYTGSGLGAVVATKHHVRGMDVKPPTKPGPGVQESIVGDIADLDACIKATEGIDAVVMCHMAPNPDGYKTPVLAFDANVKGTANLYHAMAERGIKRCVLISTMGTHRETPPLPTLGYGPYNLGAHGKQSLYGLTKILQEQIAEYYFNINGIITTALRPGWIVYDETCVTKYGWKLERYDATLIDPRDIGEAVLAAFTLPDPKMEAFSIAQDDFKHDMSATFNRLKWHTKYKFPSLPKVAPAK